MKLIDVINEIRCYKPLNNQEYEDQKQFMFLLENYKEKAFDRNLMFGHITSSAIVVNKERTKMLMCFHNIYKSWAWLGGHADNEMDLKSLAITEVYEETGLENLIPLLDTYSSIEILAVDGHNKKGKYVPSHLHYNVTFLFEGDDTKPIRIKEDENSNVSWIDIDDIYELVKHDHNMYYIYNKSLSKCLNIK